MTTTNKTLVCVVTSEATWRNLARYCFNHAFKMSRYRFDLAVICNGNSSEALTYIKSCTPEYLFNRPNLGFDLAGFDMLLKSVPVSVYDRFLLLHDDHWFSDEDWFTQLSQLADQHPEIDVFGNLLDCSEDKLVEHFEIVSRILGYGRHMEPMAPVFTQGVAGLFSRHAINIWLKNDGIPHIHNNLKNVAEICERLTSFILYDAGCSFMQIPPGFQRYLHHGRHQSHCLEAPHTIYKPHRQTDTSISTRQPSAETIQHFDRLTATSCSYKVAIITSQFDTVAFLNTIPRHRMRLVCFCVTSPETQQAETLFKGLTANLLIINNISSPEDMAALIANVDYTITDIPEAALSAAAQNRAGVYITAHLNQDRVAEVLASHTPSILTLNQVDFNKHELNTAISLAMLKKIVTEPNDKLTLDELQIDQEIRSRLIQVTSQSLTGTEILSQLDNETPLFVDIGIETTTICNMSCSYCPNSTIGRPPKYMSNKTFQTIIDSVAAYAPDYSGSISPHFYGEPLLDKRLEEFIHYAKQQLPNASIQLFTNGVLLSLQRFLALVDVGVNKFIISQHTPEPLPDLAKTLITINSDYPNLAQVEYFDQYHSNMKMNRGGLLASDEALALRYCRCNQYKALIFDVAGTAVLCCNDYLSSTTFGNIHHSSVQEIWNNLGYRRIRNMLYYSYFPLQICRKCASVG